MSLREQTGNAEGYCKKCNAPLGISGQCVICALNDLPEIKASKHSIDGLNLQIKTTRQQLEECQSYNLELVNAIRNMEIPVEVLWKSTSDFFLRFLNRYPPIGDQLRVVSEEHLEVIQAALTQPENLPGEVADLIVTCMGLLMTLGYSMDDLNMAMLAIADKNNAKTLDTHEVNSAGKIARKAKS